MSSTYRSAFPLLRYRPQKSIAAINSRVRSLTSTPCRLATQDYGSGQGDPKGEKPQEQGPNPSADKEHPGPPPPKAGQNTGGGPTKKGPGGHGGGGKSYSTLAAPAVGAQHSAATGRGTVQRRQFATKVEKPKGDLKNAEPKILSSNPPTGGEQSEEVKRHNEEMDQRAEKATQVVSNEDAEKDKVKPSFWAGQGGIKGEKKEQT